MITISMSEARQSLRTVLDQAQSQPVTITRRSAPDMVLLSAADYAVLQQARFELAMQKMRGNDTNQAVYKALADK
ncbi:type II toxin-antitoxin system Phd/YefM family antitoxin [Pantoea latae]|jgi:antitoxin Phd|uniref:Antitoxin n=1 Tax=Pantoea latae TaxID=1964541 RepID=A0A1V9DH83_9GAMM|nr:type II toxin-antitoxin system Phd/YefM family antitoxin [Pantoea latae]OQP33232.1 addiction module antitoxin, Axe family protein [Pantoea latae]